MRSNPQQSGIEQGFNQPILSEVLVYQFAWRECRNIWLMIWTTSSTKQPYQDLKLTVVFDQLRNFLDYAQTIHWSAQCLFLLIQSSLAWQKIEVDTLQFIEQNNCYV